MSRFKKPGFGVFMVIWFGQLVSTIGSGLTGFALGVWIYQQTGSTTLFSLNLLSYALPSLIAAPFAGALVDRWDRRWVMILSDAGAGLTTLAVAVLFLAGHLEVWQIYLATALNSVCNAFQWPAYSAATSLLVPKAQLGRAGGMVQIGEAASQLVAPALAGALMVTVGLFGVIMVDFATFFFAVFTTLLVRIPRPVASIEGQAGKGSLLREAAYGWQYIINRPGLLGLLIAFATTNLLFGLLNPLLVPMILDMTTPDRLGYMISLVGLGMLAGTLVMSAWGGPRRRIKGVLGFILLEGVFTALLGLRPSLTLMTIAGFCLMFVAPMINACSQAIWQSKVAADVQGRVFSARRMIAWSTTPLAYAAAGPLNDRVFKPLLVEGGPLAGSLGGILGVGSGRGTGLLFVIMGMLTVCTAVAFYSNPRIRLLEDEIPDALEIEVK